MSALHNNQVLCYDFCCNSAHECMNIWARMQEEERAVIQADIGIGLRPQNMADMRAFLNLSGFMTDFLPLCGGQPFRGCAPNLRQQATHIPV